MKNALVIGGGPAGLFAAITLARRGIPVTVLEKMDRPLKKLRITGKGRCNITNNCPEDVFFDNIVRGGRFLKSAYSRFGTADTITFFVEEGLPVKTERGLRVFPESDRADDVAETLLTAAVRAGVKIRTGTAKTILSDGGAACGVKTAEGEMISANAVLIATGGLSYPGTGSTGDGYRLAEAVGHTLAPQEGSLVPLLVKEPFVKDLMGLSLKNVTLTLFENGKPRFSEQGELLFTHFGLSGPLTLSGSAHLHSFADVRAEIDLKPALSEEQLDARILRDFKELQNRDFGNAFIHLLPKALIPVFVGLLGTPPETKVHSVTKAQRMAVVRLMKAFPLTVTGKRPVKEAVVTRGGVTLSEVDPKTMGSKKLKGLYFAGEVLDLDGYTGGFNLQIAFTTAYAAGCAMLQEESV